MVLSKWSGRFKKYGVGWARVRRTAKQKDSLTTLKLEGNKLGGKGAKALVRSARGSAAGQWEVAGSSPPARWCRRGKAPMPVAPNLPRKSGAAVGTARQASLRVGDIQADDIAPGRSRYPEAGAKP
eukprot:scaffold91440_cov53-Phaeocystis_antarctica.AAC.4